MADSDGNRRTRRPVARVLTAASVLLAGALVALPPAASIAVAETITPEFVAGNPKCSDVGLEGFKVDGAPTLTTYELPGLPGATVEVTDVGRGGRTFDWVSTFGLDQVIVKGGDSANVYPTDDARSGTGFMAPGTSSNKPAQISHVEYCYDGIERPTISADTDTVAGARGVAIGDVPLTALPASLINSVAGADLVNDAGTGLRFSGTGLRYSGTGLRFSGTGLRFSGTGLRFSGTGLRFSGTGLRFSGTGLRFSGTGLRFSGTGLRFSDSGVGSFVQLRSAGTGLRFSESGGLQFSGTGLRFSELPGWDIPLSELQPPEGYTWNDVFVALGEYEGYPPQNVTFGQLLDLLDQDFAEPAPAVIEALASMSLLDLDPNGEVLRNVSLVGLLLGGTLLADLPLPDGQPWCSLIDPSQIVEDENGTSYDCTDADIGADIGDATVLALNLAGFRSDNIPLDRIFLDDERLTLDPDSVLADLLDDAGIEGDLYVPAEPGDSLASYVVRGIDALNVPWEQLPLATATDDPDDGKPPFDVRDYALGERVTFTAEWTQAGDLTTPLSVTPPTGFVAAAEGPQCSTTSGDCTVTEAGAAAWDVTVTGATQLADVTVTVAYRPAGLYGYTNEPPSSGVFGVDAGDGSLENWGVSVVDPWLGNTDPAGEVPPPIEADVLYFGETTAGAVDRYDVDVSEFAPGSHVAVRMSSLSDDADLVLYRSAGTGLRFSGTGMRFSGTGLRYSGTGLRFSGDSGDSAVDDLEPETLEDVPIDVDRIVEDVSANRAQTPEAADGFTDGQTTNFEVQVSGYNETALRSTGYVVRVAVTEFGDECFPSGSPTPSVDFVGATGANTAVLFAEERFSVDDAARIRDALGRLAGMWPITIGTVSDTRVGEPGADWTTEQGYCSVVVANAVAESVAAQVAAFAAGAPADSPIEHVMIIGGDDKLPFYRSPDTTLIANEANYVSTLVAELDDQNPISAAFATQHILTDDIYGDDDPWPFLNRLYFTPERGVGRLVEDPADIVGQIDRFIESEGLIDADTAFTAAYDFLADVAVDIDANLADVTANRSTLISDLVDDPGGISVPDWSAAQIGGALPSSGIINVQAHMDQGLWLSAFGDAQGGSPDASEVVGPEILPPDLIGALLFTAGCHAGLNQPYANAARTDDWAQSVAGGAAAFYLANTGYGYGLDQPGIAYSEALLEEFSDLLELDGLTVGRATAFAKQAFFADQVEIDPYDEKSQMQLTVYGVPMYSLTAGSAASAQARALSAESLPATPATPDPVTGQPSSVASVAPTFVTVPGAGGTTSYAIDSVVTDGFAPEIGTEESTGDPIQPRVAFDVTADDPTLIARGAVIEELSSTQVSLPNPTIARPIVDSSSIEEPAESGTYIFPTSFTNVHTEQTPDGPRGKLVVVPAQYDSTDEGQEQLLVDSLSIRTYYAPENQADVVRPQFRNVSAGIIGPDILFRVEVEDPSGAGVDTTGIDRVLVQYFDGVEWYPVDLFPANADRTEWSGGLEDGATFRPLLAAQRVYFVQTVDGGGNVAVAANKGRNYGLDGDPAKAVAFVTGTEGDNGWYIEAPQVELVGSAVRTDTEPPTHLYSLVDNPTYPVLESDPPQLNDFQYYTGPFDLALDGVPLEGITTVTILGEGAEPITLDVEVDTRPPDVDLDEPITVAVPSDIDTVAPASIRTCSDPEPGSGLRDLDPASASDCLLEIQEYSLTYTPEGGGEPIFVGSFELSSATGQDVAGSVTTRSQSLVVLDGTEGTNGYFTTPVILGIVGAAADDAFVGLGDVEPTSYNGPVSITETTTVVVIADGETETFTIQIDGGFPTVDVAPAPTGTYEIGTDVDVECTFADAGSGLTSASCGDNTWTNAETVATKTIATKLPTTTLGEQTFTASATDDAGNTTTREFTYEVVDTSFPTITFSPTSGGTYTLGEAVQVTCTFADVGAGLDQVACGGQLEDAGGAGQATRTFTLDTSVPGPGSFTAVAVDAGGNETTRTFTYDVVIPACDPLGDTSSPSVDIVGCTSVSNGDGTAKLSLYLDGPIATEGVQYRLRLAADPGATGALVKWAEFKLTGQELLDVEIAGNRIAFVVDVDRVGVAPEGTLYWFAEVQDGVKGKPTAGFLDRAPDDPDGTFNEFDPNGDGWFELIV